MSSWRDVFPPLLNIPPSPTDGDLCPSKQRLQPGRDLLLDEFPDHLPQLLVALVGRGLHVLQGVCDHGLDVGCQRREIELEVGNVAALGVVVLLGWYRVDLGHALVVLLGLQVQVLLHA